MTTWQLALATVAGLGLAGSAFSQAPATPAAAPTAQVAPLPQVPAGRVERLADFPSRFVVARNIDVWLPAGYDPARRYQVLYLQDGQMLFDPATTWNKQAWRIDVAISRLVAEKKIPDTIVVGIWNRNDHRYAEYFPDKILARADPATRAMYVDKAQHGKSLADAYLRFIVEELKPEIDRRYSTIAGREGTFVMGSSMGGMISLYALFEYPQVFAGAAGLSAHWVGYPAAWGLERVRNASLPIAAFGYLDEHLPAPGGGRFYIDRGTDPLDSLYAPSLAVIADLLHDHGIGSTQAMLRVFDGQGHNERDWSSRLDEPLLFLMGTH